MNLHVYSRPVSNLMHLGLQLFVVIAVANVALASSGDRAVEYQNCVSGCVSRVCRDSQWETTAPLSLRLTQWTCTDDCKYGCMHAITDSALEHSLPVQQYHGKWPFWRLGGMQEPASVAFSLLNLFSHIRGGRLIQSRIQDAHPMKRYFVMFSLVSVNAWVWSSVFHTRDLPTTEKLDYFSAALAILYALYFTVLRLFHMYPSNGTRLFTSPNFRPVQSSLCRVWTYLCVLIYLCHILYLTLLPRFDYTYNMVFNISVGMIHNLLWVVYSFPSSLPLLQRFPFLPRSYRPAYAWKPALFVLFTTLATSLELFDFPPWGRIIDAHSLWHLSTVPIAAMWYDFLVQDATDDGWKIQKS